MTFKVYRYMGFGLGKSILLLHQLCPERDLEIQMRKREASL